MNKLNDKQAFMAQYFGQKVFKVSEDAVVTQYLDPFFLGKFSESGYLELTSLSDITDEHAIEVAKIITPVIFTRSGRVFVTRDSEEVQVRQKNNVYFTVIEFIECAIYAYSEDESYTHNPNMVQAIDYLRSQGYLLPFRGYTTQQLIDLGWVRLRTNN